MAKAASPYTPAQLARLQAMAEINAKALEVERQITAEKEKQINIGKSLTATAKKLLGGTRDINTVTSSFTKTLQEQGLTLKDANRLLSIELKFLGIKGKELGKHFAMMKKQEEVAKHINKEYSDLSDLITAPIDSLIARISKTKLGSFFIKSMGIDVIVARMKTDIAYALIQGGKIGFSSISKVATIAFQSIGKIMQALWTNKLILALTIVAALVYLAYQRFNAMQKTLSSIRTEGGILADESGRLLNIVAKTNMQLGQYGVTLEIAGKSVNALLAEFQASERVTENLVKATSLMQSNLGMSAEEGSKFLSVMMAAGDLTDKQAANSAGLVANLAVAGKVAPRKVMADIANSSKVINTYFRGTTAEVMKQAVGLARMGSSLKEAGDMAEKLLDWDVSIEKEMQASVMLGRHLDMSMARFFAYQGKMEDATAEVLKQVGTISDFNKLGPIQKKAIADAAGMEVDVLAKMLKQKKQLQDMDQPARDAYNAALAQLKDMNKETTLLQDTQKQIAKEKMTQAWENLSNVLASLIDVATPILFVFEGIAAVLNFVANGIKEIGAAFGFSSKGGQEFLGVIKAILGTIALAYIAFKAFTGIKAAYVFTTQASTAATVVEASATELSAQATLAKQRAVELDMMASLQATTADISRTEVLGVQTTSNLATAGSAEVNAAATTAAGNASLWAGIKAKIGAIGVGIFGATLWASLAPVLAVLLPIIAAAALLYAIFGGSKSATPEKPNWQRIPSGGAVKPPTYGQHGAMVNKPTNMVVGEGKTPEVVAPLPPEGIEVNMKNVESRLDKLIGLMAAGSVLNMDGRRVGESLVMGLNHPSTSIINS